MPAELAMRCADITCPHCGEVESIKVFVLIDPVITCVECENEWGLEDWAELIVKAQKQATARARLLTWVGAMP